MADSIPCTFTHFIVSLGQSALVALGEGKSQAKPQPALARYNLDVLRLLHTKTSGNLDSDEARLLDALIEEVGSKLEAHSPT